MCTTIDTVISLIVVYVIGFLIGYSIGCKQGEQSAYKRFTKVCNECRNKDK